MAKHKSGSFSFRLTLLTFTTLMLFMRAKADLNIEIDSIFPTAGLTTGNTRVLVRGGPFHETDKKKYPHPKCKFGSNKNIVEATFVSCQQRPLSVLEQEGNKLNRDSICLQCENSPKNSKAEIVPLMVSLIGDFSDSDDSEPFSYYLPPEITAIDPHYGHKDGETLVRVWGKNFFNAGQHSRCAFGSRTTKVHYFNSTYLECVSPQSEIINRALPFSLSFNQQQNTREKIDYWYYRQQIVSELQPNQGLKQGGTEVIIKGSNFKPFDYELDIDPRNETKCMFQFMKSESDIHDTYNQTVPAIVESPTRAKCIAPPFLNRGLGVAFVEISLNGQDWSDDNVPFYYFQPAKVQRVEPKDCSIQGGIDITIYGSFNGNYTTGKEVICNWGNIKETIGRVQREGIVKCPVPQMDEEGSVLLSVRETWQPQEFSSEHFPFTFYRPAKLTSLSPACGPASGMTQLTIRGTNFRDFGFGLVKCVFNDTVKMNATIIDETSILCSTPPLINEDENFDPQFEYMNVKIALNGDELSETSLKFTYYPNVKIVAIEHKTGSNSGGLPLLLSGIGFAHPNVCNPRVKFGAIEVTPTLVQGYYKVITPKVALPGPVTLFVSGNGQNYDLKQTLHDREGESTFTYTQKAVLQDFQPESGTSSGKTKITARGYGFQQQKNNDGSEKRTPIYVRFVDVNNKEFGEVQQAEEQTNTEFTFYSPASGGNSKAIIQLSFNNVTWQPLLAPGQDTSFAFYNAPEIQSISPRIGPVKTAQNVVVTGKNFVCPEPTCAKLKVLLKGEEEDGIKLAAKLVSSTQISFKVPAYTKPDVFKISVSFNGIDYTSSAITYGYYDPFVISIEPEFMPAEKKTTGQIKGFGFVNPDQASDLKIAYQTPTNEFLLCGDKDCIVPGTFVDKHTISFETKTLSELQYQNKTQVKVGDPISIELTIDGVDYTDNDVSYFSFEQPIYKSVTPNSVPQNLDQDIRVETDFLWSKNSLTQFQKYSNFTCLFKIKSEVHYLSARMETFPLGGAYYESQAAISNPTHIICQSPKTNNTGKAELQIAVNGQDFTGSLEIELSPALQLFRMSPSAGPADKQTQVKLYGTGFDAQKDEVFVKFGTQSTQSVTPSQVKKLAWNYLSYLEQSKMNVADLRLFDSRDIWVKDGVQLDTVVVTTPDKKNKAGLQYISVGEITSYDLQPVSETRLKPKSTKEYTFSNDLVNFAYYKSPKVAKISPNTGISTGGTVIELSGQNFDFKPQYGIVPQCKIGDKVVRARYHSPVRITCVTPPSEDIYKRLPIQVSLNGVDWVSTGLGFSYYYEAKINSVYPKKGLVNSGSWIYIIGDKFWNVTDPEQTKCRFTLLDNVSGVENRPIIEEMTQASYVNSTTLRCLIPGKFIGGDRAYISLTYNNKDYSEERVDLVFSFYQVDSVFPLSGPLGSTDPIIIKGSGIDPKDNVNCILNSTQIMPIEVTPNQIKCPMSLPNAVIGKVSIGISIEDVGTEFEKGFYYYNQVVLDDVFPRYGPAEGKGKIYLMGQNLNQTSPNLQIGCKVGDSIGKGVLVDSNTIQCIVEKMDLVNEGDVLPVYIALNSYSWVGETESTKRVLASGQVQKKEKKGFVPYGIIETTPDAGVLEGFTDIMVEGKGFRMDPEFAPKCRFGTDYKSQVVDAIVLDYNRMMCRSPAWASESDVMVPFGVSFTHQDLNPWTKGFSRFYYYKQPTISHTSPIEIDVRKKTEIYVFAKSGSQFTMPVPTHRQDYANHHQIGRISCNFGSMGKSMGMYLNATTLLCLSPHISGNSDEYTSVKEQLTVAFNGQDFVAESSSAYVTFKGTGQTFGILFWLLTIVLFALFLAAVWFLIQMNQPTTAYLPNVNASLRNTSMQYGPRNASVQQQSRQQKSNLSQSAQMGFNNQ